MYDKFEFNCKKCRKIFYTPALSKIVLQKPDLGINLEIDLQHHFMANSFTKTVDTPKGKVTIDIRDMSLIADCSKCGQPDSYLLSEISPI